LKKILNIADYLGFQFFMTFFSFFIFILHIILITKDKMIGTEILMLIISINLLINIFLYYLNIRNKKKLRSILKGLRNNGDITNNELDSIIINVKSEFKYIFINISIYIATILVYIFSNFFDSMGGR